MSLGEGQFAALGCLKYRVRGGTVREGRELVCVYKVMGGWWAQPGLGSSSSKIWGNVCKRAETAWHMALESDNPGFKLWLCPLSV